MPLNMQENDEFPVEDEHAPPPIRRTESPQGPALKTVALIVLLVAFIGGGGYLLYRFKIFGKKSAPTTQTQPSALQNPWKAETTAQTPAAPAPQVIADEKPTSPSTPPATEKNEVAKNESVKPATSAPVVTPPRALTPAGDGRFALYISSYRDKAPADEEASRWSAAGFSSFVETIDGWHRVVLGRYADMAAAKKEALRWKPALENGFWIAPQK